MAKMNLYDCRVVIGGGHLEVPKLGITEYEIQLLRGIHGADAVKGFRSVGEVEREPKNELHDLGMKYGDQPVEQFFGVKLQAYAPIVEDEPEANVADAITLSATLELPEQLPETPVPKRVSGTTAPASSALAAEIAKPATTKKVPVTEGSMD